MRVAIAGINKKTGEGGVGRLNRTVKVSAASLSGKVSKMRQRERAKWRRQMGD